MRKPYLDGGSRSLGDDVRDDFARLKCACDRHPVQSVGSLHNNIMNAMSFKELCRIINRNFKHYCGANDCLIKHYKCRGLLFLY